MDDTTLVEVNLKTHVSDMQPASDDMCKWSATNQHGLNTFKTNDMLMSFGNPPQISPLIMNNTEIEMVTETKLLGVYIQSNLKWDAHIEYLNKKAASRLYFLRCLKRSGLSSRELVTIYITMIRSVLEYACPVWSTCLTKELSDDLESIQERACRIILSLMLAMKMHVIY